MIERATDRAGASATTAVLLASAQLVALTPTVLSRIGQTVPGFVGWPYAIAVAAVLGIAAGGVVAGVRPSDWSGHASRLWYGPAAFGLLVVATELEPVVEARWLGVVLGALGTSIVLAGAADVVGTTMRHATRSGPLPLARALTTGGLVGLAGAVVVIAQGTPPLIWVVLLTVGYAATMVMARSAAGSRAGVELSPWLVCLLLLPILAVGPAAMDDSAIRTPSSSLRVMPTLIGTTDVTVNNVPAGDIRDGWSWERNNPYVGTPYAGRRTFERILVLDAGTGNAVGRALAAEPDQVDAVEADRGLISAAQRFRPDRAYADSRVTVHEQDPRAALRRLSEPYDLIVVARADPHLLTTTVLDRIRSLLKPNGRYAVHDSAETQLDAATRAADAAFGHPPCVERAGGGFAVVAAADPDHQPCAGTATTSAGEPPTDDRPFTATESTRLLAVSGLALVALGLVLLPLRRFARPAGRASLGRPFASPMLLGAATLLGAAGALHAVAAVPVLRILPVPEWAAPMVLLGGWLACLLAALGRPVRKPASILALTCVLALCLLVVAAVPTEALSFAGALPRLAATAGIVGLPVLLGACLLAGAMTEPERPPGDCLVGITAGVAAGLAVAGVVGVVGYSGLFVVAAVPVLSLAVLLLRDRARRAQQPAQALSTAE